MVQAAIVFWLPDRFDAQPHATAFSDEDFSEINVLLFCFDIAEHNNIEAYHHAHAVVYTVVMPTFAVATPSGVSPADAPLLHHHGR